MAVSHLRAALSQILRSPSRLPTSSHAPFPFAFTHRLLASSAAAASSSGSFAAEDYLVSRFGLTKAQALKASARLSHLRSSAKPEAVLAYLESTLGVSTADVGRVAVVDPGFLCTNVEKTLAPRVADLRALGLSRDQIARLVPLAPNSFRSRLLRSKLEFWLAELGSFDKLLQVQRWNVSILSVDLDNTARPNVAFLRQCGLNISEIPDGGLYCARLFTRKPERLKEAVQRVEELGIGRGTGTFRPALTAVAFIDKDVLAKRMRLLHNIGFSKADVLTIVRKQPRILGLSEQKLQEKFDFLVKVVGLEVSYIVQRPTLLTFSVEGRLLPRHCLMKVLKDKGLLKGKLDYYVTAAMSEKIFVEKFVRPFKNHVSGLTDDYASKVWGEAIVD
jgi:mTERF domain-containing protein